MSSLAGQELSLKNGIQINRSVKVKTGIYQLTAAADTSLPVILVEGNDLVIDFNGAILQGDRKSTRLNSSHRL